MVLTRPFKETVQARAQSDPAFRDALLDERAFDDLSGLSAAELLVLHARVADELRARGVTRTSNNPTGDLAESLFCKAFGWHQAGNSHAHIDAVDDDGIRYQIKGRRLTRHNGSRQLSAIRNLDGAHFDFLAGVLFAEDYSVLKAALIPPDVVVRLAKYVEHTNSHKFLLRDDVWDAAGVVDVTERLRSVRLGHPLHGTTASLGGRRRASPRARASSSAHPNI